MLNNITVLCILTLIAWMEKLVNAYHSLKIMFSSANWFKARNINNKMGLVELLIKYVKSFMMRPYVMFCQEQPSKLFSTANVIFPSCWFIENYSMILYLPFPLPSNCIFQFCNSSFSSSKFVDGWRGVLLILLF